LDIVLFKFVSEPFISACDTFAGFLPIQIIFALLFVKMFNRVSKHRARHRRGIFIQKIEQFLVVSLSGFAHPAAYCFMNQILFVAKQNFGDLKGVGKVALPNKIESRDDRCAAFLKTGGTRHFV
jgi:hypothetical protein